MSERPTPETDALWKILPATDAVHAGFMLRDLSRKIERDRDEAIAQRDGLQRAYDCALRQMNDAIAKMEWLRTDPIAQLERERDEARIMADTATTRADAYMEAMDQARNQRDKMVEMLEHIEHYAGTMTKEHISNCAKSAIAEAKGASQ